MDFNDTARMIKGHEGFRDRVYADSLGNLTGGYGHYLEVGSPFPSEVANIFFKIDFAHALNDYYSLKLELDPVRRAVIIDMLFNMGLPRLSGFKKMLAAIRAGDYSTAADEMMNSRWAGQVKVRAVRLAKMMRTGQAIDD